MRYTILLLLAALGCASMENRMVYHPRSFNETADVKNGEEQDVTLEGDIHARWSPCPKAIGAILFCHGNAGNLQGRSVAVKNLWVATGESVLIFDYPGYGKSKGAPSEKGCYDAAEAAYQWLVREQKIPSERIIIYGESLGGAVAVDLASKHPHGALVLERTFTSAPDVADYQMPLFPGYWVMTNRFDSLAKIPQCRQPIFIAAADKDTLIPFQQAEKLYRASRESRPKGATTSELFVLKGLGHNDPLPTDYYAALRTFLATNANLGWTDPAGTAKR